VSTSPTNDTERIGAQQPAFTQAKIVYCLHSTMRADIEQMYYDRVGQRREEEVTPRRVGADG
jgi:hypothetical protein